MSLLREIAVKLGLVQAEVETKEELTLTYRGNEYKNSDLTKPAKRNILVTYRGTTFLKQDPLTKSPKNRGAVLTYRGTVFIK